MELKELIENILIEEQFKESLNLNFGETLKEYKKFTLDNTKIKLNNFEIE